MALTDEGSGNGFYMPVAPAYGYGGNGGGFGFGGGDWAWILLLLLIGGNGWGFGGGFGGGMMWPMMMGCGMSRAGRMNAKRDNMGRYSRDGYSYADSIDGLIDEMRGMMGDLPEEKRREVERFVNKMDRV